MTSSTSNRHRMWCRDCNARRMREKVSTNPQFTLRRHPRYYRREIKCPHCGSTNVRSDEARRRREMAGKELCECGNYPFPHKKGEMKMCEHSPIPEEDLTEEDYLDYEACLATRRG